MSDCEGAEAFNIGGLSISDNRDTKWVPLRNGFARAKHKLEIALRIKTAGDYQPCAAYKIGVRPSRCLVPIWSILNDGETVSNTPAFFEEASDPWIYSNDPICNATAPLLHQT